MFLSKNSQIVLDSIIKSVDFTNKTNTDLINRNNLAYKDIVSALIYLDSIGYIKIEPKINNKYSIILLEQGRYYKKIKLYEVKNFFIKSILTPIFISIITSFIVNYALLKL